MRQRFVASVGLAVWCWMAATTSTQRSTVAAFVADPKRNNGKLSNFHSRLSYRGGGRRGTTTLSAALSASLEPMDGPEARQRTSLAKPPATETAAPLPELDKLPVNHKIVVFGSTGQVGRLVVRQLLEEAPDGTQVVAVVRDYDKVRRICFCACNQATLLLVRTFTDTCCCCRRVKQQTGLSGPVR